MSTWSQDDARSFLCLYAPVIWGQRSGKHHSEPCLEVSMGKEQDAATTEKGSFVYLLHP